MLLRRCIFFISLEQGRLQWAGLVVSVKEKLDERASCEVHGCGSTHRRSGWQGPINCEACPNCSIDEKQRPFLHAWRHSDAELSGVLLEAARLSRPVALGGICGQPRHSRSAAWSNN